MRSASKNGEHPIQCPICNIVHSGDHTMCDGCWEYHQRLLDEGPINENEEHYDPRDDENSFSIDNQ